MRLPAPNLDDRRFQDILDEARRLIPRYCPEWTDHNLSDPGITLLELFAFVHPARFVVPTGAGLARALGLVPPADDAETAAELAWRQERDLLSR